ncbi:MAG: spore maturation protein [Deltaproteobacteria bacterium]|nr:spore maturation protein [Deltaproteobacteria bacterium]
MDRLSASMFTAAQSSVTLAINLIGAMALFLGLMKVAEEGGLLQIIARTIRPIMVRLFPDVPPDHPAMGAMILNMAANALGLGNAATPFGIRAMQELNKLNPRPGTASNAMVLFLAINTSSVTLLPTGVIAIRQGMGSADPAGILATTLFATVVSTVVAVGGTKLLQRVVPLGEADESVEIAEATAAPLEAPEASEAYPGWVSALAMISIVLFIPAAILWGTLIAPWVVPALAVALLSFGAMRGVKVYESFVEGAKDGFQVAIKIIPYLVAILVAVAMFRASGALDALVSVIDPVTSLINLPGEALPMALLRPLSGSGAYGVMVSIMQSAGPDSYVGYLVSTLQGSTETTFYVLAVYFGAVQVQRTRHALPAALMADTAGVLAAVFICSMLFG